MASVTHHTGSINKQRLEVFGNHWLVVKIVIAAAIQMFMLQGHATFMLHSMCESALASTTGVQDCSDRVNYANIVSYL